MKRNPDDSVSRRSVLKVVGGGLAGTTAIGGRSAARQDPDEVVLVKINEVECERHGGQGNLAGRIHLGNQPGFATDNQPWIEARIVAVNGSYSRSIILGPGATTTDSGLENGTYKVQTYFDPDSEGSFDPDSADPVFVGEETVDIDCPGPYEFDLEFDSTPAVVGEPVVIEAVSSREPDRGFDYYWDLEAGDSDGISGDPTTRETTDDPRLEYVYEEPGEYEVELTVEFLDESELTVTETLTVEDPDADSQGDESDEDAADDESDSEGASFELLFEPSNPRVDEPVTCEVVPSDEIEGEVAQYRWDINGDGRVDTTTGEGVLRWKYTEPGEWKLVVTAVLEDGSTVSETQTVTVEDDG